MGDKVLDETWLDPRQTWKILKKERFEDLQEEAREVVIVRACFVEECVGLTRLC